MNGLKDSLKKWGLDVSMGLVIAVAVLIVGLVGYLTILNLNRQRAISFEMLEEKGAALIRSFEAGTRSAMMESRWGDQGLKRLLFETGQQPDIAYLMVVNEGGVVVAHNDPALTGTPHEFDFPFDEIIKDESVHSGIAEKTNVFEVYKKFTPTGPLFRDMGFRRGRGRGRGRHRKNEPMPPLNELKVPADPDLVIFVGLKLDAFEKARRADTYQAIATALILLAVGISGSLLIYLAQGYKTATSSLSKEKALSYTIVRNMPTGLMTLSPERKVITTNETAKTLLGLDRNDGLSDQNMDDVSHTFHAILSDVKGKYHVIEKEVTYSEKSGKKVQLQLSATKLFDDRDRFLGYVLLIKDLSEIRSLKETVEKNKTMAAIGRMAAGLAHEIRNPLSSLKGFAVYFKERYPDNPKDQQISGIMIEEVDRLNRVINQLLDLSRPVRLSKTQTFLNAFLKDFIMRIEPMAKKRNIELMLGELDTDLLVLLDTDKIHQALLNIFLNAMESMSDGGTISISLHLRKESKGFEMVVRDQGSGINPSDLGHIFDPYFTTKSTGTGIGLAIVHNIILAHQGTIEVKSEMGEGTEMKIVLPVEQYERKKITP